MAQEPLLGQMTSEKQATWFPPTESQQVSKSYSGLAEKPQEVRPSRKLSASISFTLLALPPLFCWLQKQSTAWWALSHHDGLGGGTGRAGQRPGVHSLHV